MTKISTPIKRSLLGRVATVAMLASLTACTSQFETPLHKQEPFEKLDYDTRYNEDRVTFLFSKYQRSLSNEHRDKLSRFLRYYKGLDPQNTDVLISVIDYPDAEGPGVPSHNKPQMAALVNLEELLQEQNIEYRVISELDIHPDPEYTEAAAKQAILATVGEDETVPESLIPDAKALERPYKLALMVRVYDIRPANCPKQGAVDLMTSNMLTSGMTIGCSVHQNMLAQVKDKTHLVHGDESSGTYNSAYAVKRLNDFYEGKFTQEKNQTDNVETDF